MVNFNNLNISADGKSLAIDVSVKEDPYYTDVYLKSIKIYTQEEYEDKFPISKEPVYKKDFGNVKTYQEVLPDTAILANLKDNLFFVYVETIGNATPDVPCGEDSPVTLGTVFYPNTIFCSMVKALERDKKINSCSYNKEFVDKYLIYKAFHMALMTGDNTRGIEYYKTLKSTSNTVSTISKCGCV